MKPAYAVRREIAEDAVLKATEENSGRPVAKVRSVKKVNQVNGVFRDHKDLKESRYVLNIVAGRVPSVFVGIVCNGIDITGTSWADGDERKRRPSRIARTGRTTGS